MGRFKRATGKGSFDTICCGARPSLRDAQTNSKPRTPANPGNPGTLQWSVENSQCGEVSSHRQPKFATNLTNRRQKQVVRKMPSMARILFNIFHLYSCPCVGARVWALWFDVDMWFMLRQASYWLTLNHDHAKLMANKNPLVRCGALVHQVRKCHPFFEDAGSWKSNRPLTLSHTNLKKHSEYPQHKRIQAVAKAVPKSCLQEKTCFFPWKRCFTKVMPKSCLEHRHTPNLLFAPLRRLQGIPSFQEAIATLVSPLWPVTTVSHQLTEGQICPTDWMALVASPGLQCVDALEQSEKFDANGLLNSALFTGIDCKKHCSMVQLANQLPNRHQHQKQDFDLRELGNTLAQTQPTLIWQCNRLACHSAWDTWKQNKRRVVGAHWPKNTDANVLTVQSGKPVFVGQQW